MFRRFRFDARAIAAVVVLVVLFAVGFVPLFGGPGYEQSLASALVVPGAAAIATAVDVSGQSEKPPVVGIWRGVTLGAGLSGIAFLTALLHGIRVGICDLGGGALSFVLTAGIGGMVGGAWGAVVAQVCRNVGRRRFACALLATLGPLGGVAASIARFYWSPMIFAYDPFFGYFSGTLYDTVVDVRPELWTYRAGSVATLAGVALVAAAFTRTTSGSLRMDLAGSRGDVRRARTYLVLGIAALGTSVAITMDGPALGHWQTAATIAEALGGRAAGRRCDLVYPDALRDDQVDLLVRDCEEELAAAERRLGAHLDGRVTAFVFRDASEKRRLMGAAQTSIAKPWRREVYIQYASYPHPVLGHEIAHVVAGSFAAGPFRVGGGILPNPGLIEGVAVATSPDDDELTDGEWARAMLDLGTLPSIRSFFSLRFLGSNAQKSYTVAGAFTAWIIDRWGAATVRSWYGGRSIETLTGESWSALDADFRTWLRTLPMPVEAREAARARFELPSVWARTCPHVVDALDRDADRCRDEHRIGQADALYSRALSRDPGDYHARFMQAKLAAHDRDEAIAGRGRDILQRIVSDPDAPRTWRDRAAEAIADDDLVRGRAIAAAAAYRELGRRTLDEDVARTFEIKLLATSDPTARQAVVDLLFAEPGRAQDPWLGAMSVGMWAERAQGPDDALADYLAGKNLTLHEEYDRAAPWLDRAIEAGTLSARIAREALRERAIDACVVRDVRAIARLKAAVASGSSPFEGILAARRDGLLRLLDRCGAG